MTKFAAKFKRGDRVIAIENGLHYRKGQTGTVDQDDNECPYVIWDKDGSRNGAMETRLQFIDKVSIESNYQIY